MQDKDRIVPSLHRADEAEEIPKIPACEGVSKASSGRKRDGSENEEANRDIHRDTAVSVQV